MAQKAWVLRGDCDALLRFFDTHVVSGSVSATMEATSEVTAGDVRSILRVYERYSMLGGNRVSLSVMVVAQGDVLHVSAVTSGGSEALAWKLNTFGEQAFLDKFAEAVAQW